MEAQPALGVCARDLLHASGWAGTLWPPQDAPASSPDLAFSEDTFPFSAATPLAVALAFSGSPERLCGETLRLGSLARSLWVEVQLLRSMLESRRAQQEHVAFLKQAELEAAAAFPLPPPLPPPPLPLPAAARRGALPQPIPARRSRAASAAPPAQAAAAQPPSRAASRRHGAQPPPPPPPPPRRAAVAASSRSSSAAAAATHPPRACSPIKQLRRGEGTAGGRAVLLEDSRLLSLELRSRIMGKFRQGRQSSAAAAPPAASAASSAATAAATASAPLGSGAAAAAGGSLSIVSPALGGLRLFQTPPLLSPVYAPLPASPPPNA